MKPKPAINTLTGAVSNQYKIENTTPADLEFIYGLFDKAIEYQLKNKFPVWKENDKSILIKDIDNKSQYKIVIENHIAIVFSVFYKDPLIWGEKENGDAVYLHRIVVNPSFKGKKLFAAILHWTLGHAKEKGCRFVRMDTWADNPAIIDYYKGFGFRFMGNCTTPDSLELPPQYRKLALTLLEMDVLPGVPI